MSNTALATTKDKVSTVRDLLEKSKAQIALALPRQMTPDRMVRVAMTSIQRTPKLLDCDPRSLVAAIIQASQLGLEPDGALGHAYLVPYGNTVTFIPGYRGLIDLARRSGQVSTIEACAVYPGDTFIYERGLEPRLIHRPQLTDEDPPQGTLQYVYAVCKLRDGGVQYDVMSKGRVEAIRKRSKAGNNGPWVTDYEEMAKKTVLRRLCKLLPLSVEIQKAVAHDEAIEIGMASPLDAVEVKLAGDDDEKPVTRMDEFVAKEKAKKPPIIESDERAPGEEG